MKSKKLHSLFGLRWKIGHWASNKAHAYYKSQYDPSTGYMGSYKDLPRYLEILVGWGYNGWTLRQALFQYRWVIR